MKSLSALVLLLVSPALILGTPSAEGDEDSHSYISPHIIFGVGAQTGQIKFHALVISNGYFNGGVLISNRHVLTVALRIIPENRTGNITVVLGSTRLSYWNDPNAVVSTAYAADVALHPGFNQNLPSKHNLAIITLPRPVPTSGAIGPIRLSRIFHNPASFFSGLEAYTSGYGRWSYVFNAGSEVLRVGKVFIYNHWACTLLYGDPALTCTIAYPSTICDGDYGGPLFVIEPDGNETLVGIANFPGSDTVLGRCSVHSPAAYTYTGSYLLWIARVADVTLRK